MKKENLGIRLGKLKIPPLLYQDDKLAMTISYKKLQNIATNFEIFQKKKLMKYGMAKSKV